MTPQEASVTSMIIISGVVLGLCVLCFCSCGVAGAKQILANMAERRERAKMFAAAASAANTTGSSNRSTTPDSAAESANSFHFSDKMREKIKSIHGAHFRYIPTSSTAPPWDALFTVFPGHGLGLKVFFRRFDSNAGSNVDPFATPRPGSKADTVDSSFSEVPMHADVDGLVRSGSRA
ncbi:hypothetical protein BJ741DRAFT_667124 [Chytriomyces cf. hyalinus JEL632]|nr:hypothetical protein BJ741DRAFT_667124 [Chytriomyces cf. hyalinus JEL632]